MDKNDPPAGFHPSLAIYSAAAMAATLPSPTALAICSGPPVTSPGGEYAGETGAHAPIHPDRASVRFQSVQQHPQRDSRSKDENAVIQVRLPVGVQGDFALLPGETARLFRHRLHPLRQRRDIVGLERVIIDGFRQRAQKRRFFHAGSRCGQHRYPLSPVEHAVAGGAIADALPSSSSSPGRSTGRAAPCTVPRLWLPARRFPPAAGSVPHWA